MLRVEPNLMSSCRSSWSLWSSVRHGSVAGRPSCPIRTWGYRGLYSFFFIIVLCLDTMVMKVKVVVLFMYFQSSVTEVETLKRQQTQFEETLEAQVEQLDQVEKLAKEMIQQNHYDSENVRSKSRALATRWGCSHTCYVQTKGCYHVSLSLSLCSVWTMC